MFAGSSTGFSIDDLYELVDESKITLNYVLPDQPDARDYAIDYRMEGKRGHLFLIGIGSRVQLTRYSSSKRSAGDPKTRSGASFQRRR